MKKIAIMQPYFYPYLGYFGLIKHTDKFILLDSVQFIRHGWIERNRVLKQGEGWLYIKVPLLRESRDSSIKDSRIDNTQDWKSKIKSQLQHYKKTAPYYRDVMRLIETVLSGNYDTITELNKSVLESVCEYLEIKYDISIFSDMNLSIETAQAPDEWALNICKSIGDIDEYWNPIGGQEFFDKSKYDEANIKLVFYSQLLNEYSQKRLSFEPGLSIIDVLMFNSVEDVNKMMDEYQIA